MPSVGGFATGRTALKSVRSLMSCPGEAMRKKPGLNVEMVASPALWFADHVIEQEA
jgi:hypothetical protein